MPGARPSSSGVIVQLPRPVQQVGVGMGTHACALTTDHQVYCWGISYDENPAVQRILLP
jgi:hypothetical protein